MVGQSVPLMVLMKLWTKKASYRSALWQILALLLFIIIIISIFDEVHAGRREDWVPNKGKNGNVF
jgi:hypothetical protein